MTSDLCDPDLSIWGLSRKFREAGRQATFHKGWALSLGHCP